MFKIFCDRCGREIIKETYSQQDYHAKKVNHKNFCEQCRIEYRDWLKRTPVTPQTQDSKKSILTQIFNKDPSQFFSENNIKFIGGMTILIIFLILAGKAIIKMYW